ncbi:ATPase [Desmophyllum pertusum]|uniref:ATPase n=1 Tax=Desmophyllum pertusum TaxID=174260 RepID=A0A9W9Y8K6_9CNID|nr:ATPase [Desmophyllum pertusum]
MGDRSSLLRSKRNPKALGYSTFDPGGSIDSGLSRSTDANRKSRANDASERVSISWENIQVFVEQPGLSFLKRLCTCFGTKENEIPTSKQVLFNVSGNVEAGTLLAVMGASFWTSTTRENNSNSSQFKLVQSLKLQLPLLSLLVTD